MNAPVIPPLSLPTVWWEWLILLFGAYRLVRLAGWDDWPPIVRVRAWVIGERWVTTLAPPGVRITAAKGVLSDGTATAANTFESNLPGKTPSSEVEEVEPVYDRPTLAHLFHCPWCLGFWLSLAVYLCWLAVPAATLYALTPFAISTVIGFAARNLDP